MNYLTVENLTKSFGTRTLFHQLGFSVEKGQRTALIARNGEGKSTLLKILAGRDTADEGLIRINKDIRVGYLSQSPELDENKSILDNILSDDNKFTAALKSYELAADKLAEDASAENESRLTRAANLIDSINGWDYESKIRRILTHLDIHHLDLEVKNLSGGQKKRVALAKILVEEPELYILDEPTNHLDIEMVEWLEAYILQHAKALFLVTHDRTFLDRVANQIIEMENGRLYRYSGNYADYLEAREQRLTNEQKEVDSARNLMRKELDWMRRQPKARTTKSKSRIDAFYKLEEKAVSKNQPKDLELQMNMSRLGGKIIEMSHVGKTFGNRIILSDFSYAFKRGERVGFVGPNGSGKSSFLNLITGELVPDSGHISTGETIVFGYYRQTGLTLKEDKRVIEVVTDIADHIEIAKDESITASQFLQRFGFSPERQYTFYSKLSGGEQRRLHLLTVLLKNPNFLILDEPTNDLDIFTLNSLEDFLSRFTGCLIIVSHDRYFLDKLAQHLFIFEGQGIIKDFNGSYSEYRESVAALEEAEKTMAPQKAAKPEKEEVKKKPSFKDKRMLEELEGKIEKLEQQKKELENHLSSGQGKAEDFAIWSKELNEANRELESAMERWAALAEKME